MQVQFIGAPASGKSTLAKELISSYPEDYIIAEKKYNSFSRFLILNPIEALIIIFKCLPVFNITLQAILKSKVNFSNKIIAPIGLLLNVANYRFVLKKKSNEDKIIIWDELLLQRSLSIFAYSDVMPEKEALEKFVKWSLRLCEAKPVYVYCDDSVYIERLRNRGLPLRMRRIPSSILNDVIAVQVSTLNMIAECLEKPLVVDAGLSIKDNVYYLHSNLIPNNV